MGFIEYLKKERAMSEKHTPGPWQINEHSKERDGSVFADVPDELYSFDNRLCICVAPHLDKNERWMANARVIAAAPDMLSILQRIIDEKCDSCSFEHGMSAFCDMCLYGEAVDIVAKAKGEKQ